MSMNESTERESILPALGEIRDLDFGVRSSFALTPEKETLLGVRAFLTVIVPR